jgi:pyrimidine operon attenuation protein/uracil phosphoribosyltransferase
VASRAALHRHPHRRCLGGPGPAQELGDDEPLGTLDVSFYRDDFSQNGLHPQVRPSELPFEIEGQHLVLVDDVLMSGRTIRAALNELFDYGRPASVTLVCLLDLDAGELPIRPDVVGPPCRWPPMKRVKLTGPAPLALERQDLALPPFKSPRDDAIRRQAPAAAQ